jgi:hypothetical protein
LGEWLWLAPFPLYLLLYAIARLSDGGMALALLGIAAQCSLSLAAVGCLIAGVFGSRSNPVCHWTDLVGCSVCAALGPVIALVINASLSQL